MHARVRSGAFIFAALASIAFAQGGLEPRTWRLATLAFLALAAAALLTRTDLRLAPVERWTLLGFASVVVWTAISAAWSSDPSASFLQSERVLVYESALLALLLCCRRADVAAVLVGAVAAITLAGAYGLARKAFAPPPIDQFEGYLLFQPLGYANGLGIFSAVGILIALGLAAAWQGRRRTAALAPLGILVPTLYFTSSRGAGLALVAGLGALVVLSEGARRPVVVAATAAAAAILAVAVLATRASRLSPLGKDRPRYWRAALAEYSGHPALGAGAGTFGRYWLHHRPDLSFTRTPHSLYLESLADLGPMGVVLVAASLLAPLAALRRGRTKLTAAAAGGYVAALVHTGIDWDWELPAAALAGLVCGGALLLATRDAGARPLSGRTRTALLVAIAAVAAFVAFRTVTGPATPYGS